MTAAIVAMRVVCHEGGNSLISLEELRPGVVLGGVTAGAPVKVINTSWYGDDALELCFRTSSGQVCTEILYRDAQERLTAVNERDHRKFNGDGSLFRLACEARRIRHGHLFDPLAAVHSSLAMPLPHQVLAVYESMLPRKPLRFLLADDPGAGKTVMTGLLIKELIWRGDIQRCLLVCPGGLTQQWQDELARRFQLHFARLSEEQTEAQRGNPFLEENLLIAPMGMLARNPLLREQLTDADCHWDCVVCDEAHQMSASFVQGEIKASRRYQLGQLLAGRSRHLLLLTAHPQGRMDDEFQLLMALLDQDRFSGQFQEGLSIADTADVMRGMTKAQLLRFDERPLFPERRMHTVIYSLSDAEEVLYNSMTEYARAQLNCAETLADDEGAVNIALGTLQRRLSSSPEAVNRMLRLRREGLSERLQSLQSRHQADVARALATPVDELTSEDFKDLLGDVADPDIARYGMQLVARATASRSIDGLREEIATLEKLEAMARDITHSHEDRKWRELAQLLSGIFAPISSAADAVSEATGSGQHGARKLVIFTSYLETLHYLQRRVETLLGQPGAVVCIHEDLPRQARHQAQDKFRNDPQAQVLIATDTVSDGLNLQHTHLLVNYDLPWNLEHLERRMGRIHRIGQTETCHFWNLVADSTREGHLCHHFLTRLNEAHQVHGGQVYDLPGSIRFAGASLQELLLEAVRHGEMPEVRLRLDQQVSDALAPAHVRELLEARRRAGQVMDVAQVRRVRETVERAGVRRLQPHYLRAFFMDAARHLGIALGNDEDAQVLQIRQAPIALKGALPAQAFTFDNAWDGGSDGRAPAAEILTPGHPGLGTLLDVIDQRYGQLLEQGAVLVDDADTGAQPRVLFLLEHSVHGGASGQLLSRRTFHIETQADGSINRLQCAPYLDYRPLTEDEPDAESLLGAPAFNWINRDLEDAVQQYAVNELVAEHVQEVRDQQLTWIDRTTDAVRLRLAREIGRQEEQLEQLLEDEHAGLHDAPVSSIDLEQRLGELKNRQDQRLGELERARHIAAQPASVTGVAVIVPGGLLTGQPPPQELQNNHALALGAVMREERWLGYRPEDHSQRRSGYHIESGDPGSGMLRFIAVKPCCHGDETVVVTRNELLCALNKPDDFILALVELGSIGEERVHYLRRPFTELADAAGDFNATVMELPIARLMQNARLPG